MPLFVLAVTVSKKTSLKSDITTSYFQHFGFPVSSAC